MKNMRLIIFVVLFFQLSYSQLDNFNFNVSTTNETCLGNGSLNFTVTNTTIGATMSYAVYLLPNITTPLATLTVNSLTGLNAGNYLIIATQSLDGNSASKQQNATIENEVQLLTYTLSGVNVKCGNDGSITVNVATGNAVYYQILTGPVTTPLQTSNVFSNLPIGVYGIRVYDNCGDAVVQTYTLEQANVNLIINPVSFSNIPFPTCNTVSVFNSLSVLENEVIAYPLNFTYTVFPPGGGAPFIYNQTVNSALQVTQVIPFYYNQPYFFNLQAVDACGNIYNRDNNLVDLKLDFEATVVNLYCEESFLEIEPKYFTSPFTVSFLNSPADFNPLIFNSNHPGPFTDYTAIYSLIGNALPSGNYQIQITDACGRFAIKEITAQDPEPTVIAIGDTDGCGGVFIAISDYAQMISVNIIDAPTEYSFPLPHDISNLISSNGIILTISVLPIGSYTFEVVDSCGNTHLVPLEISETSIPLLIYQNPACEIDYGSIGVYTSGAFSSVVLIDAPVTYNGTLPENLSANILGSSFSFGQVPSGNYTFLFTSGSCGATRTELIYIEGYHISTNDFSLTPHCGAFDIFVNHESNGIWNEDFWLQKFNPTIGQWVHPATGVIYVDGSVLNGSNAIQLVNNANNLNFAFTGQFRVLKNFNYLQNTTQANCIDELYNFDFSGGPQIINVNAILCTSTTNQVIVEAIGVPPLTYSITSKNGLPFLISNGTSNTFIDLEPAIYNFQVQDVCGNIVNSLHDITALDPLSITASNFCDGENGSLSVQSYPFLIYEWWKADDPTIILSTSSFLNFTPYNSLTDYGQYYVRITNVDTSTACVGAILDYEIPETPINPNAGNDQMVSYCGNQGIINLNSLLTGNFSSGGNWVELTSSGVLIANNWDSTNVTPGVYEFKYIVTGSCSFADEALISITILELPTATIASSNSDVCENDSIQLFASSVPGVTYIWTGPNGFTSNLQNPVIANATLANAGTYSVRTLANGCESLPSSVIVNVTPLPQLSAGSDNVLSYCGYQGNINLFNLLLGSYDLGGTWEEITFSGNLNGNQWQSNGVNYGTYQFKYSLTGVCNFYDEAFVTITINEIPTSPIASINGTVCENSTIYLLASSIPNANYIWSGPNGFSSNLQNPSIDNATVGNSGIYSVMVIVDGCESVPSSVNVTLSELPEFVILFECIGNVATLKAKSVNNSFNESTATYQWSNGSGFSSATNPTNITGQARGEYTVTVTDTTGCSSTQTYNVLNTLCTVPGGISPNGDGKNDTFDLSGFSDILNVQIFNRWGMLVYEKDNYINEWYGQLKNTNTLVPTGTYFYIINFASSEAKAGWVYLSREKM